MSEAKEMLELGSEGEISKCPHCRGSRVIKDHGSGQVICPTCGRVIEEKSFDRGPEWRAFNQEERENKSRGGPPRTETIHDRGLTTQIDRKNRDAKGKSLSPEKRQKVYRMRKWQKRGRVEDAKDRNLSFALSELQRLSSQLGLPRSVQEGASRIYREIVEEDMVRGRSIEGMISAVVYLECRIENIPRSLGEVAEVSYADKKEIGRNQRFIEKKLDVSSGTTDPANLVSRFGSKLDLSGETRAKTIDLIKKAQQEKITSGKSPSGIVAGALYMASLITGERRTQRQVSKATGVTKVTVRNRYKELETLVEKVEGKPPVHEGGLVAEEAEEPEGEEQERRLKAGGIKPKSIKYENVVASVVFRDTVFDLERLADVFDLKYKPGGFPGVSYSPEGTKATFLIFKPGKANCVGTTSISEARRAPKLLAEKLKEEGFEVDPDPEVKIRNLVIQANFGVSIDLRDLHDSPHETSYDPESFPGLQLMLDEPDVDILLFASGQGVLHAGREKDVNPAFERIGEILTEFATETPLNEEEREVVSWLEKNPRFAKLLELTRDEPEDYSQIAEELGVKEATAKQYVVDCGRKNAVEREEENGEIKVKITEKGRKALDVVA